MLGKSLSLNMKRNPAEYMQAFKNDIVTTLKAHQISVISEIGKGGFASVYKCYSSFYSMDFALKIFPLHINQAITASFDREIELLSRLDHPNIIRIFQQFRDAHFAYILMEICENGSLIDYVAKHRPLNPHQILRITHEIAEALKYCHERNVIHNDIKPHNILLDKFDRVKVTDFGISIIDDENVATNPNVNCGTFAFLAPERFHKKMTNLYAYDLWALGLTVYYLEFGNLPWTSSVSKEQTIREISGFSFIPPEGINHEVGKVITKLLRNDPNSRVAASEIARCFTPCPETKSQSYITSKLPPISKTRAFKQSATVGLGPKRTSLSNGRQASILHFKLGAQSHSKPTILPLEKKDQKDQISM